MSLFKKQGTRRMFGLRAVSMSSAAPTLDAAPAPTTTQPAAPSLSSTALPPLERLADIRAREDAKAKAGLAAATLDHGHGKHGGKQHKRDEEAERGEYTGPLPHFDRMEAKMVAEAAAAKTGSSSTDYYDRVEALLAADESGTAATALDAPHRESRRGQHPHDHDKVERDVHHGEFEPGMSMPVTEYHVRHVLASIALGKPLDPRVMPVSKAQVDATPAYKEKVDFIKDQIAADTRDWSLAERQRIANYMSGPYALSMQAALKSSKPEDIGTWWKQVREAFDHMHGRHGKKEKKEKEEYMMAAAPVATKTTSKAESPAEFLARRGAAAASPAATAATAAAPTNAGFVSGFRRLIMRVRGDKPVAMVGAKHHVKALTQVERGLLAALADKDLTDLIVDDDVKLAEKEDYADAFITLSMVRREPINGPGSKDTRDVVIPSMDRVQVHLRKLHVKKMAHVDTFDVAAQGVTKADLLDEQSRENYVSGVDIRMDFSGKSAGMLNVKFAASVPLSKTGHSSDGENKGIGDLVWVARGEDYSIFFVFERMADDILKDDLTQILIFDHDQTKKDREAGRFLSPALAVDLAREFSACLSNVITADRANADAATRALLNIAGATTSPKSSMRTPHVIAHVLARAILPGVAPKVAQQIRAPGLPQLIGATAAGTAASASKAVTTFQQQFSTLFDKLAAQVLTSADVDVFVAAVAKSPEMQTLLKRDSQSAAKICAHMLHATDARLSTLQQSCDRVLAVWETGVEGLEHYAM